MKNYCQNCYYPLPYKAKFCPHCGQKSTDIKIGMGAMLKKLWDTTFHLESKTLRSLWQLLVPGLMSAEFFKGKQGRYPHPLRLFLVVMFFFLILFNSAVDKAFQGGGGIHIKVDSTEGNKNVQDVLNGIPYEKQLELVGQVIDLRAAYESLPAEMKNKNSRRVFDSLSQRLLLSTTAVKGLTLEKLDSFKIVDQLDTINVSFGFKKINLAAADVLHLTPEGVISRYGITNWADKILVRQGIKTIKAPNALGSAYVGSLTWTLLAQVTALSGVLFLLYIRRRRYYVEHFIFLLHFHTGLMLALTLAWIPLRLGLGNSTPLALAAGLSPFAFLLAMRRFYGQGWAKTVFKWLIFTLIYIIIFSFLFILGILVVFAIF
jgi:Protein of unknown function (DUF3667)